MFLNYPRPLSAVQANKFNNWLHLTTLSAHPDEKNNLKIKLN